MKKIRRQTAKQTQRFNRKRYRSPQGIRVTATLTTERSGKNPIYKGTYIFKENGDYIRMQQLNGKKRYKPVYFALYGADALKYLWKTFN